jgi:hypothetical protein
MLNSLLVKSYTINLNILLQQSTFRLSCHTVHLLPGVEVVDTMSYCALVNLVPGVEIVDIMSYCVLIT